MMTQSLILIICDLFLAVVMSTCSLKTLFPPHLLLFSLAKGLSVLNFIRETTFDYFGLL